MSEISFPTYESDPKPENPLKEKWEKLYPPIPKPEYSQVCDGYSCMWCGRCPRGENWKCPEEDAEIYAQYQKELNAWFDRHSEYFAKAIIQLAKEHKDIMED